MRLHDFLNQFPPSVIRLMAHKGARPLTDRQIAQASGLSNHTVWRVSHASSWESITVGVASRFCHACGADIINPEKIRRYLSSAKMLHLNKNPKYFARLMNHHGR